MWTFNPFRSTSPLMSSTVMRGGAAYGLTLFGQAELLEAILDHRVNRTRMPGGWRSLKKCGADVRDHYVMLLMAGAYRSVDIVNYAKQTLATS